MVCIQDPICNLLFSVCFDNTKSVVCSNGYADGNWLYSWQGEDEQIFSMTRNSFLSSHADKKNSLISVNIIDFLNRSS